MALSASRCALGRIFAARCGQGAAAPVSAAAAASLSRAVPPQLQQPFPALRGLRAFSALSTAEEVRIGRAQLVEVEAVPFGDLLAFLDERYGLQGEVVKEPLSELAEILGYERVAPETAIRFGDMRILMEEVGTYPATRREFRRFLRRRDSGAIEATAGAQDEPEQEDLEEWYRFQNAKDLLAAVRKHGAVAESLPQGWLRVTTPGGAVVSFKQIGRKERAKGEGGLKERPFSDKKIMIRACPDATHPIAMLSASRDADDVQALATGAGPRRNSARRKSETPAESAAGGQLASARKVNLRVREPTNTGRGSRPRRRGSSACAHHAGNRLWNRRVSAQTHVEHA